MFSFMQNCFTRWQSQFAHSPLNNWSACDYTCTHVRKFVLIILFIWTSWKHNVRNNYHFVLLRRTKTSTMFRPIPTRKTFPVALVQRGRSLRRHRAGTMFSWRKLWKSRRRSLFNMTSTYSVNVVSKICHS